MNIKGLENNYYLSGNDIWIRVAGLAQAASRLELTCTNHTTGTALPLFVLYPSPANEFIFNICLPVRALFPDPDHININTMQMFDLQFRAVLADGTTDTAVLTKYFIRGGRNKDGAKEWFLSDREALIVGSWVVWDGITLPKYPLMVTGGTLTDFVPSNYYKVHTQGCDVKVVMFLNSLGGYQFFVFEKWEESVKPKALKNITSPSLSLRQEGTRSTGTTAERQIELYTLTPSAIQEVFADLTLSPDIYIYNPAGTDDDSRWQRMTGGGSASIRNNYDEVYDNRLTLLYPEYTTIQL